LNSHTFKKMKLKKNLFTTILLLLLAMIAYTIYPVNALPKNTSIDSLIVYKSKRQLIVYEKGKIIKTYKIALGKNPVGDKKIEGDKKTPEGRYIINSKNPKSTFHKNLGISYPNSFDRAEAKQLGHSPGGDVKIHGLKNGLGFIGKWHRSRDWTNGCIALTNSEIDELYNHVLIKTPIIIYP